MKTYLVERQHLGDRMYMPGDEREASPGDVQHLVNKGVLVEKSAPKSADKADKPVSNKADAGAKNKSA